MKRTYTPKVLVFKNGYTMNEVFFTSKKTYSIHAPTGQGYAVTCQVCGHQFKTEQQCLDHFGKDSNCPSSWDKEVISWHELNLMLGEMCEVRDQIWKEGYTKNNNTVYQRNWRQVQEIEVFISELSYARANTEHHSELVEYENKLKQNT